MDFDTGAESQAPETHFKKLPRELRDLVYADLFAESKPTPLENVEPIPAKVALLVRGGNVLTPDLTSELLEAFYTHTVFHVTFPNSNNATNVYVPINWGPHPQYRHYIRNLVVHAQETRYDLWNIPLEAVEDHCLDESCRPRADWECLLKLPRLEELTIRLQKYDTSQFVWAHFSPVLIQIREAFPKIRIIFSVSFDMMLERVWDDPFWENFTEPGDIGERSYDPMGFVDMTELIALPTAEDSSFVQEHLAEQQQTLSRDFVRGLLDETAAQRRALAVHYAVKEPALMRVRMLEHYEVYKKRREANLVRSPFTAHRPCKDWGPREFSVWSSLTWKHEADSSDRVS
ncbi:hypothetical protein N0V94_002251 [Neodidymelliopsis sp. IMI 364377]|nr:hypothetical protein N0V94_002251 [Neodidymelliopsis sp. IMI 364377]